MKNHISKSQEKLAQMVQGSSFENLVKSKNYREAIEIGISSYKGGRTFSEKMRLIWLIRDLVWLENTASPEVYSRLSTELTDKRDGDLIRTLSVVLGDCVLIATQALADKVVADVNNFYKNCDIDGSQIVIGQTMLPLKKLEGRLAINSVVPKLKEHAANKSVMYTLDNLNTF